MTLVAGIDSSTHSCRVVIRDAATGALVRSGAAAHPPGTEVDPQTWWVALGSALDRAGGLADVGAVSVAGQPDGTVVLDSAGVVVRPALRGSDAGSARAARDLVDELGAGARDVGARAWAEATGCVPRASHPVTALRRLADQEPDDAARVAAVALPHDWLTWRLAGAPGLSGLVTDRSEASGTGYWSPTEAAYRTDLLELALGRSNVALPRVLGAAEAAGEADGVVLGPGAGAGAAAALGLGMTPGDVAISIGRSGVVSAVAAMPTVDPSGLVAGGADATGAFLTLVRTRGAAGVLDSAARLVGVDLDGLSRLALSAPAGSDGLVLVPYLEDGPPPGRDASGSVHGLSPATSTPAHLARAAVEGLLCAVADGLDALMALGVPVRRVLLVGDGARSEAVRAIAPAVLGRPVTVPPAGEHVADGAARQAAWALAGGSEPPGWAVAGALTFDAARTPAVRDRWAEVQENPR